MIDCVSRPLGTWCERPAPITVERVERMRLRTGMWSAATKRRLQGKRHHLDDPTRQLVRIHSVVSRRSISLRKTVEPCVAPRALRNFGQERVDCVRLTLHRAEDIEGR